MPRLAWAVVLTCAFAAAIGCARSSPRTDRLDTRFASAWVATENRDHPLVGKIWNVRKKAFATEQELHGAVVGAHLLFLGETHDNPDHHLLQARLVRAVTATGRRPAIAFEMLDDTQQAAIDATAKTSPHDVNAIRDAARWDQSGWPAFKMYRPIFEAALEANLPIVAANLPRERIRAAGKSGLASVPEDLRVRIERNGEISKELRDEMREEMNASHCGEMPETILDPLILAQRVRDAQLASRLESGATADGAILISGSEHARLDRGVPGYLSPAALAKGPLVSVGFQEVDPEKKAADAYGATSGERPRFDFVVFTPGQAREDPCIKLREQMRQMRRHAPVGQGDGGTQL